MKGGGKLAYISKYDIDSLKILRDSITEEKYNYFKVVLDKIIGNIEKQRVEQNKKMKLYQQRKRSDKNDIDSEGLVK